MVEMGDRRGREAEGCRELRTLSRRQGGRVRKAATSLYLYFIIF
jgi:hypothetical protein